MKSILVLITLTSVFSLFAQQDPLSTQFWNNYALTNPATSGLQYDHHATVNYRSQWDRVNGAPWYISANYGTKVAGHHGLGITYMYDRIGFSTTQGVNLNYNYQFTLGADEKDRTLSVGVGVGFRCFSVRSGWIPPSTYNDASLPGDFLDVKPNLNAGLAYKDKGLLVGIGTTHLTSSRFSDGAIIYKDALHYYAMGSYTFRLGSSKNFELIPRVQLRTDAVFFSGDVNLEAAWIIKGKQRLWFGTSYRTSDAVCAMVGIDVMKRYRIGYSYDYTINKLSAISRGSHEIVLAFLFQRTPKTTLPANY